MQKAQTSINNCGFTKLYRSDSVSEDLEFNRYVLTEDCSVDMFKNILQSKEKICSVLFINEEKKKKRFIYNLRNFSSKRWKNMLLNSLKNDLLLNTYSNKKKPKSKIISNITKELSCIVNPTFISCAPMVHVAEFIKRIKLVRKLRKQNLDKNSDIKLFRGDEELYGIRLYAQKDENVEYLPSTAENIILNHYIYIIRALQRIFSCIPYEDAVLKTPQKFNSTMNKIKGGKNNIFRSMCITSRIPKSCRLLLSSCNLSARYCYIPDMLYKLFFPESDPTDLEKAPTMLVVRFPTITTSQLALQVIPWDRETFGLPYSLFSLIAGDCDGDAISLFAVDSENAIEVNMLLNPWFRPYNGMLKVSPSHDFILSNFIQTQQPKNVLIEKLYSLVYSHITTFKPNWTFSKIFHNLEKEALQMTTIFPSINIYNLLQSAQNTTDNITSIEQCLLKSQASSLNDAMLDQIMIRQGYIPTNGTSEIIQNNIHSSILQGPKYGDELISCVQSARGSVVYGKIEIKNSGGNLNKVHFNTQHLIVSNVLTVVDGSGAFVHDEPGLWFPKIKQINEVLLDNMLDYATTQIESVPVDSPIHKTLWHRPTVYEMINLMNYTKNKYFRTKSIDFLLDFLFVKQKTKRFVIERKNPNGKYSEVIPFNELWINSQT